jgi:hypothetical protein
MGATRIMVLRHAEKPGVYHGVSYDGVRADGRPDPKSLVTLGWERAGGLVALFVPPCGPAQGLSVPTHCSRQTPRTRAMAGTGERTTSPASGLIRRWPRSPGSSACRSTPRARRQGSGRWRMPLCSARAWR